MWHHNGCIVRSIRRDGQHKEIPWWRDGQHKERDSLENSQVGEGKQWCRYPIGRTRNVFRNWRVMTGGMGIQDVAQAGERNDIAGSTDMATTMWLTLRADGLKPHFSSGNDMSTFTAMPFSLNKRTTESVANLMRIDIMTIACKKADGGSWERRSAPLTSGSKPLYLVGFLVTFSMSIIEIRGIKAPQRQVRRRGKTR